MVSSHISNFRNCEMPISELTNALIYFYRHTAEIVDYSKTAFEIQTQRKDGGEQGKMINKSIAVGHCFVEQFDDQEDYGYEYISSPGMNNKGLCVGMVYTPLTER